MKYRESTLRIILGAALAILPAGVWAAEPKPAKIAAEELEFFESKIRPVLVKHCYECHSADSKQVKGGLLVDSRQALLNGGDSGPAILPGEPNESLLLEALRYESYEMPPDKKLPEKVIRDFERWIRLGAPDPRVMTKTVAERESSAPAKELWSLNPVQRPELPIVKNSSWSHDQVDRFVLAKLEAANLVPVDDASEESLLRRLYFDLIGLPPTLEQAKSFLTEAAQDRPAAVDRLVDELLASPHFGERWGRHWLDIARYAESNGMAWNMTFPYAWRYRDYVIHSLNEDKPYDQFVVEQLAGDLLPAESIAGRNENLVATGFLALGSKPLYEKPKEIEQNRPDWVDEQLNVIGKSLLGLTVGCARCHDHKFDPIPTADYYSLAGVFFSTEILSGPKIGRPPEWRLKRLFDGNVHPLGPPEEISAAQEAQQQFAKLQAELKNLEQKKKNRDKQNIEQLQADMEKLAEQSPKMQYAFGVREAEQVASTAIRIRGQWDAEGEVVPRRGYLSAVSVPDLPEIPKDQSGRLQFAKWVVHPENPLTARVIVNRVWAHLFGLGLVATVDNFGSMGVAPTHPELLDYLADRFVHVHQWSLKSLIRELVLSRTYQLASRHSASNYEVDPDNQLLWRARPRRLQAEAIRDALLLVGGKLEREPLKRSAVDRLKYTQLTPGEVRKIHASEQSQHRSVYLAVVRGQETDDLLSVFDFPDPGMVVGQREATTVPSQSLVLMNSPLVLECAAGLADRVLREAKHRDARIDLVYQIALTRSPTADERKQARAALASFPGTEQERMAAFAQTLLLTPEFRFLY